MVDSAETIWRDFVTDGIAASGRHQPRKAKIREWGTWLESLANLAFTSGRIYSTKSALTADLAHAANSPALVVGDPTAGNDGLYMKVGGSGSGSWTQLLDFVPGAQLVRAADVGAGTPNTIQATTNIALSTSGSQLVLLEVFEANTGSPVTVSFNGGVAYTIKTASGNDVASGGLSAGPVFGVIRESTFRLLSDQASAAIVAAAEAAQAAAEAARDEALAAVPAAYPPTRDALAALSDTTENAYLTEAGFQGLFAQVDISGGEYDDLIAADTVGGEIKVKTNNPNLAYLRQRKYGDLFKVSEFGDDLHVAVAAAMERGSGDVLINRRTIGLTAGFVLPGEVGLIGEFGRAETWLDFSGVTDSGDFTTGNYAIHAIGVSNSAFTTLPSFTAIGVNEFKITFGSAHGLSVDDIVNITDQSDWSFSGYREYYWGGWISKVVAVDGLSVYMLDPCPVALTYNASTCIARKVPARRGKLGGFTIDLHDCPVVNNRGIHIEYAAEAEIADLGVEGAYHMGIYPRQCYGLRATGLRAHVKERSSFAGPNDYPMIVGNSQQCKFQGDFSGNWCGTDVGGDDRDGAAHNVNIEIFQSTIRASYSVMAAGMHGNAQNTKYTDCFIDGAASICGTNSGFYRCRIQLQRSAGTVLVYASEINGGVHELVDCDLFTTKNASAGSLAALNFGASGKADNYAKSDIVYRVKGGKLTALNELQPIYVYNNTARADANDPSVHPEGDDPANYSLRKTSVEIDCELYLSSSAPEALRCRNIGTPGAAPFCIMKPRSPLPTGVKLATFVSYAAQWYDFPVLRFTDTWTLSNSGTVNNPSYTDFANAYPLVPHVYTTVTAHPTSEPCVAFPYIKEAGRYRLRVSRFSGSFTDGQSVSVDTIVMMPTHST